MNTFNVTIKSASKNWSGKEFSKLPAKLYMCFDDAVSALNSYHFFEFDSDKCEYIPCDKKQSITFIFLNAKETERLIREGKIRY